MEHALISDRAIFGPREWSTEHLLRQKKISKKFEDVEGRHEFWLHPTSELIHGFDPEAETAHANRIYASLRIDSKNLVISGDMFADIRRRDWTFSWASEAIFTSEDPPGFSKNQWRREGWDLLTIADVFKPQHLYSDHSPENKMALAIRLNSDATQIAALRIVKYAANAVKLDDWSRSDAADRQYESLRRMSLFSLIHIVGDNADIYEIILRRALGHRGRDLRRALWRTGVKIIWEHRDHGYSEKYLDAPDETELELLAPYQWTENPYRFAVLITTMDPGTPDLVGSALGLDGKAPLQRARFGAVVYLKNVIDSYLLRNGRGGIGCYEKHMDALVRRVRNFYLHELGHLMNLPHPWQRDRFLVPSLPANPGAKSLMNYGSRYPLGQFMETSRRHAAAGDDALLKKLTYKDSDRNADGDLARLKFTKAETRWLHHAPFDQITPGGGYFTQPYTRRLKMDEPSVRFNEYTGKYQWLELDLWDTDPGGDDYVNLPILNDRLVEHSYLFGEVSLRVPDYFAEAQFYHFTFQAPMLSLLVRSEYPAGTKPNALKNVRVAPAIALPLDAKFVESGESEARPPDWLARQIAEAAKTGVPQGRFIQYERFLPILNQEFFKSVDPDAEYFTVQAMLRTDPRGVNGGKQNIYSNQVRVRFVDDGRPFEGDLKKLLQDPNLSPLLELLTHAIDGDSVENILLPSKHRSNVSAPVFKELANLIRGLNVKNLPFGKTLFSRMQGLLFDLVTLDKLISTGSVPQGSYSQMFRTSRAEMERFLRTDSTRLGFFRSRIITLPDI